jgi:hypothetical protein
LSAIKRARRGRVRSRAIRQRSTLRRVLVPDAVSQETAVTWWDDLKTRGGEGMVVTPFDFVARDHRGLVQPVLKIRGREREPRTTSLTRSVRQALAGPPRVRPRRGGAGALRQGRVATADS